MNRINQLFNSDKKDILSIYFCAGDPTLEGTAHVIRTLEKNGVDMIRKSESLSATRWRTALSFRMPLLNLYATVCL